MMTFGCSRHTTGPDQSFSLKISVKDPRGNPVAGLRVSMVNDLAMSAGSGKRGPGPPARPLSTTSLGFEAPKVFRGTLGILSIKGNRVVDLLAGTLLPAGAFRVNWTPDAVLTNGVYVCRFSAADTGTGSVLFRDSNYVVLHDIDPALCVIGWTNGSGEYETGDPALFPNLIPLPPIPLTDASGPTVIGTFRYLDSVTVTVVDTLNHIGLAKRTAITNGTNAMDVLWVPSTIYNAIGDVRITAQLLGPSPISDSVVVPTQWKLRQNYPNPFN